MNSNNKQKPKVPCESSCAVGQQKIKKSKGTSSSKVPVREEPKTRNVSTWTNKREPCRGPCTKRKEPEKFICERDDCKCKVCKNKPDAGFKKQRVAPQEVSSATLICPGPCAQGQEIKDRLSQKLPKQSLCTCVDCLCSVCDINQNVSKLKEQSQSQDVLKATSCKSTCTDSCTIKSKINDKFKKQGTSPGDVSEVSPCTDTCTASCTQTLTAKSGCTCVDCICSVCYAEVYASKQVELPQEPPLGSVCRCGNCLCTVCPVKEYAAELDGQLPQKLPLKVVCQCTDCVCPVCEHKRELPQDLPPIAVCQCTDCDCSVCAAKEYADKLPQKPGFVCKCGDCLCYVCDDEKYAGRLKQKNAPPPDFSHIDTNIEGTICPAICAKGEEVQAQLPQKFTCKCKDCICYVCDDEKYEGKLQQQAPPPTVEVLSMTKKPCPCKSNKCGKCSKGFVCKCVDCICYVCDDDKRGGKVQENAPPLDLELLEKRRTESMTKKTETCACKSNKCGKCFRGFVCKCIDCICYVCDDDKRSGKVQENAPPLDLELLEKRKIESEKAAKGPCACRSNKCGKCFREIKEHGVPSMDLELLGEQPPSELGPQPESELKLELEAQPESEPPPESEPESDSEAKPESEPQPELEPESQLEPQPKSQSELEPQSVSSSKPALGDQPGKTVYCKCGRRTCNCHLYFEKYGPISSTGENAPPATPLPVADEAPPSTEEEAEPTVEKEPATLVEEAPSITDEGESPSVAEEDGEEAPAGEEVEEGAEPSPTVAEDGQLLPPPPAEGETDKRICKCRKNKCGKCARAPPPSVTDEETVVEEDASIPVAEGEAPSTIVEDDVPADAEKDVPPPAVTEGEPPLEPLPVEGKKKKKKKICQCTSKKCKICSKDFTCKCPECICYVCDDPKYETRKQADAPPLDMALLEKNKAESQAKASKKICKCRRNRCGKCPKADNLVPPPTPVEEFRCAAGVQKLLLAPPAKFKCSCENCLCYVCDDEKYEGRLKQEPAPPINEKLLPKVCKHPCTGKCGNRLPCK